MLELTSHPKGFYQLCKAKTDQPKAAEITKLDQPKLARSAFEEFFLQGPDENSISDHFIFALKFIIGFFGVGTAIAAAHHEKRIQESNKIAGHIEEMGVSDFNGKIDFNWLYNLSAGEVQSIKEVVLNVSEHLEKHVETVINSAKDKTESEIKLFDIDNTRSLVAKGGAVLLKDTKGQVTQLLSLGQYISLYEVQLSEKAISAFHMSDEANRVWTHSELAHNSVLNGTMSIDDLLNVTPDAAQALCHLSIQQAIGGVHDGALYPGGIPSTMTMEEALNATTENTENLKLLSPTDKAGTLVSSLVKEEKLTIKQLFHMSKEAYAALQYTEVRDGLQSGSISVDKFLNINTKYLDKLSKDLKVYDATGKSGKTVRTYGSTEAPHNQERINKLSKLKLKKSEDTFSCKSEFFRHLINYRDDLEIYLTINPALINAKDENGMTLLHHSATIGRTRKFSNASPIQQLLFSVPGIDLNVKDLNGDTPVHVAAAACDDRVTCQLFPVFLKQAISHGFDCSSKGANGYTVLHLSALHSYDDQMDGSRVGNLSRVLGILIENKVPNLKPILDALSDSGATALYYCITRNMLEDVETLLKAGAAPLLCGQENTSPLAAVSELKETLNIRYTEVHQDPVYDYGGGERQGKILDSISIRQRQVGELGRRLEQEPSWLSSFFGV